MIVYIEAHLGQILYLGTFLLFAIGLYAVLMSHHVIRTILGLGLMENAVNLLLILSGYRFDAIAPIVTGQETATTLMVDPIPQAMILTSIVIGVAVQALALALCVRVYGFYGTLNTQDIQRQMQQGIERQGAE